MGAAAKANITILLVGAALQNPYMDYILMVYHKKRGIKWLQQYLG